MKILRTAGILIGLALVAALLHQVGWSSVVATLGISVLGLVMRIDYRNYREPAFIWSGLAVVSVGLVAVLFSSPVNNARRWFSIGGLGVQPSELAKLAAIFFIAALLERHGPMLFGLCRRLLRDEHLAEDVLQATFLVLSRKAGSIRRRHSRPACPARASASRSPGNAP